MSFRIRLALLLLLVYLSTSFSPFTTAQSQAPQPASCIVDDDLLFLPACVIRSRKDVLYVPHKYWKQAAFNHYGLSALTITSLGNVYINRVGRIVIRDVATMDNGPDEFHHGLVRIDRDGKWGFADPNGRTVVPIEYSCALNYAGTSIDAKPRVCVGCRIEQQGEYHSCIDGKWFYADRHGHLTPASDHP